MTETSYKTSYTVPCASAFRDAVTALAQKRRCNVADLARSVLLLVSDEVVRRMPDPGGPGAGDREATMLKSGPAQGRPWRRKPRLQVRLAPGYDISTVRRALNLALALDRDERALDIRAPGEAKAAEEGRLSALTEELERHRAAIATLVFQPLSGGVRTRADALHVLGFAPSELPDRDTIRGRFRALATIHHPDSATGSHLRMSQLNQAVTILSTAR